MAKAAAQKSKAKIGRPSIYDDSMAATAAEMALNGATDAEIARELGVRRTTIYDWNKRIPGFADALKKAKAIFDSRVERTLAERALGYSHPETKFFYDKDVGVVSVDTIKHYPPDTTAAIFWLKNRDPENWRDVQKVEADVNHNIKVDDRQLALAMINVLQDANRKVIEGEYTDGPAAIESSVPGRVGVREDSQPDPVERGEGEELATPARLRRRA